MAADPPLDSHDPCEARRRQMVDSQLRARGIANECLLAAFGRVPRHRFIPGADPAEAYGDHPVPIACGQTISQPYVVAFALEALELQPGSRVLEVGTGSGYQTALLAELVSRVCSVEYFAELAAGARCALDELGYANVEVVVGDGSRGWPHPADLPFDAIIGSAAAPQIPPALVAQLADGGRLVMPVGRTYQELVLVSRRGDRAERRDLLPVRFVPMR